MSPYTEWIELNARTRCEERKREAARWRLVPLSARTTWPERQMYRLLCRLGVWLTRVGRHLQTLYGSQEPAYYPDLTLHAASLGTDVRA